MYQTIFVENKRRIKGLSVCKNVMLSLKIPRPVHVEKCMLLGW